MSRNQRNQAASSRRAVLGSLAVLPLFATTRAGAAQSSIDEVNALLRTQKAAWNRGDIAGFCAPYSEDCIFLSPSGVTRGRQTVQDRYAKKYGAAKETMGQLAFDILDIRTTSVTVTMAMRWSLTWSQGGSTRLPATGSTLIVWQLQKDGWRLVQDASM